jgi:hypothetical protein
MQSDECTLMNGQEGSGHSALIILHSAIEAPPFRRFAVTAGLLGRAE